MCVCVCVRERGVNIAVNAIISSSSKRMDYLERKSLKKSLLPFEKEPTVSADCHYLSSIYLGGLIVNHELVRACAIRTGKLPFLLCSAYDRLICNPNCIVEYFRPPQEICVRRQRFYRRIEDQKLRGESVLLIYRLSNPLASKTLSKGLKISYHLRDNFP